MTSSDAQSAAASGAEVRLAIRPLEDATRTALIGAAGAAWDRPTAAAYVDWRYRQCVLLEARMAMAGGACVAMMCAFHRSYRTAAGSIECLEPFDWYALERWRALGAGLRVVKAWMADGRPLIALGGTPAAIQLFERLRWRPIARASRFFLPLRGRFLRRRGRAAAVAFAFDLTLRWRYRPRATGRRVVDLIEVSGITPAIESLARTQRRFALLSQPDPATGEWLRSAPLEMGVYSVFELRRDGEAVGYASTREYVVAGIRVGEIQDLFCADDARGSYPDLVQHVSLWLARRAADVVYAVTTCEDTIAALRAARFRLDEHATVFAWGLDEAIPGTGVVLVSGSHADRAIFPVPTAAEARDLTP